MATQNSLESVVLNELKLPPAILSIFEALGFDLLTIIRISKDELTNALLTNESISWTQWNFDEIFGRLVRWRQQNGYEIIDFNKVEVEEFWIEETGEEQETSSKENEGVHIVENSQEFEVDSCNNFSNPTNHSVSAAVADADPQASDKKSNLESCREHPVKAIDPPVPVNLIPRRIVAPVSANIVSSQPLPTVPVELPSKQTDAAIRSTTPDNSATNLSDSAESSATATSGCHSDGLQEKIAISDGKKAATECPLIECSNHHFTPSILLRLLEPLVTGREILERAKLGRLSNESQQELVAIIADYHHQKGVQASQRILDEYATSIVSLFKSESKGTYFIERGGGKKNPGGKIYSRIVNSRQKSTKRKLKEEQHLKISKTKPDPICSEDPAATDAVQWLERNTKPWGTTLEKWIVSFPVRKSQLMRRELFEKLFKDFHHYEEEFGYQLIDEDFRLLDIGNGQGLKKWEYVLPKIIQYVDKVYKDNLSKSVLEFLKSPNRSQCEQISAILLLLNNFLRPTKVTKTFKPSILSAQEDIILFADTDEQALEKLDEVNSSYSEYGFSPTARLLFRGQNIDSLTGVFEVYYRGISYKLDTAARAIDVLVKLNTTFGLEFSRISRLVWNFICTYIYELPVQEQYECINKIRRHLTTD